MGTSVKSTRKSTSTHTGFTIVELLIVIVVIGILAAITIVAYNGIQTRAKAAAATSALNQASRKIAVWQVDNPSSTPSCVDYFAMIGAPGTDCSAGLGTSVVIGGVTYQYKPGSSGVYCITSTSGSISYRKTNDSIPVEGACTGHGSGGVAAVTNLVTNPSAESNYTGWGENWGTSATGTSARMTNGGKSGDAYLRMTWSAPASVQWGGINFAGISVTTGKSYTASVWVRSSSAQSMRISLRPSGYPTNLDVTGTIVSVPVNTWTRLSVTVLSVPSGITFYQPITIRQGSGSWQAGDVLDHDALMMTEGSAIYGYADGSFTSQGWDWTGAPNNSTSMGPPQ